MRDQDLSNTEANLVLKWNTKNYDILMCTHTNTRIQGDLNTDLSPITTM